jgi:MtN3 and saliva related transmembrane protein
MDAVRRLFLVHRFLFVDGCCCVVLVVAKGRRHLVMNWVPDFIGYAAACLTTLSFLPQAYLTIKTRDTESLSLSMYGMFSCGVLLWLIYGCYKQDWAIIVANAVTLLLAAIILAFKIRSLLRQQD